MISASHFFCRSGVGGAEGVANGEVIAEAFPEPGHVVVAGLAGVVGGMDTHTDIEADNDEVEVVTEAETGAESEFTSEVAEAESSTGMVLVVAHEPYVAGVHEERVTGTGP